MSGDRELPGWLLVTISTGQAASLRVYVWRQLRKLGAVYLQQSTCLLPDRPDVAHQINRLTARVREQNGHARVLRVRLTDSADHAAIVAEQRADRDTEYAEILERTPAFLAEIQTETDRGRATYTEVEESEVDLQRFERWLDAIAARDYFDAPGAAAARQAIEDCRAALTRFEQLAFTADTTRDTNPHNRNPYITPTNPA
jgi:hypothetical protein